MTRTATLWVLLASIPLSAQTPPASTTPLSISWCVAQVQRDGSLGAKGTGTQATPETAATEANNPEPTGRYQLNDATPLGGDRPPADAAAAAKIAKPARTTYALRGQEAVLAKHVGHRVQIGGTLMASLTSKLPSKTAATAEGVRTVQVSSMKMIGTNCSVAEGK